MWLIWESTECQRILVLHIRQSMGRMVTSFQTVHSGRRYHGNGKCHGHCHIRKRSINRVSTMFGITSWKFQRAVRRHQLITELSATFIGRNHCHNIATIFYKWTSTERQQLFAPHLGQYKGFVATLTHDRDMSSPSVQKLVRHLGYYSLTMIINGSSTILGYACWKYNGLFDYFYP